GLGHRFLGHLERCGAILHLVDGTADDVVGAYRTVRAELAAYGGGLADKPEFVGLNKIDALDAAAVKKKTAALARAAKKLSPRATVMALSGATGAGVAEVLRALMIPVEARRTADAAAESAA